jgi:hypothetical protein
MKAPNTIWLVVGEHQNIPGIAIVSEDHARADAIVRNHEYPATGPWRAMQYTLTALVDVAPVETDNE